MPKEHSPQMLNWAYPQRSCNSPQVTNFNSMIFKTITSSVDETRKTLALFNKDWNTYKRNWQNANGVFGKIGSVFTPANAITKSDIEAIKAYNSQIDSCVTSQTAFNRTMLNASPAAQNLVASYNGGKVSAQGMATAQNAAKESTIGLTIAQTALNAAIGMGIGLLISLFVKGIDKLVHANEEAIEKAEELRRKYEEFKSTNESNVTTLKDLKKEFEELSKGVSQYGDNVSLTTEQYERYKEIIQQVVGMSPSLAEGYSTENGYIADKNGLLERAIELQEIEYRNELRKITNLENLKTSMSGYIAEYKDALNGGFITAEGNIVGTTIDTDFKNSLWQLFNTNNRENYDGQSMAKDIMDALGVKDIDAEMQKYFNEYGYWQDSWFWNDYCDTIINNLNAVTDSLSFEEVGLDEDIFDQNLEKLESYAESYRDMKDSVEMANNAIQTDLGYIAEYADGYSKLSTEQQKFVTDFLKGFNISDITSENAMGFLEYDNDKMASVKSQIKKFVETLSQDESTKTALADLYAIPTDEQSISEFVEQFRNALEIIKAYCQENGIEIPIAITDSEQTINNLEAQYQRAVDFAKDKFDGYDPTAFFKEHSVNTQEEIDKWQEIAQGARDAAEAEKEYIQGSTLNKNPISFSDIFSFKDGDTTTNLGKLSESIDTIQNAYKTLSNAIDEYNDEGAFSIDTLQSVISLGDDWLDYLVDEEGKLKLDKESLEQLTLSRLNDMRIQAINNVIDNVSKIENDAAANDYLKSTNYALIESYEGLAKAKLEDARASMQAAVAAGDLSQENMDAAMSKAYADIEKINKLFNNTDFSAKSITGGSGSSKSSKSEFDETIDFFERRVKVLDDSLSHLKSSLENVSGSFGKNNLIDAELNITSEKFRNYTDALSMYTQKADESLSKLPADIAVKVKDGAVALTDFVGDGNKDVVEAIKDYESWAGKVSDCKQELAELRTAIRQLELEKFNNIISDFTDQFDLRSNSKDLISKQIDLLKESGELVGESFFISQIDQSKKQLELLENEKAQLINQMTDAISSGRVNCCPLLQ